MDINAVAAKLLLIFLLGVAIWFILGKIEILEGSILRDVFAGAISVVLAEVLFNYANTRKKKMMNHSSAIENSLEIGCIQELTAYELLLVSGGEEQEGQPNQNAGGRKRIGLCNCIWCCLWWYWIGPHKLGHRWELGGRWARWDAGWRCGWRLETYHAPLITYF